jgi:hypothetical protein
VDRRDFFAASCLLGASPWGAFAAGAEGENERGFYELRRYHLLPGAKKNIVGDFLRDAGIAALNRHGVGPVGVFNVMFGPNKPTLYVLLPHKSLESIAALPPRLLEDAECRRRGAALMDATLSEPAYVRLESSLMAAFTHMPHVELPPQTAEKRPRIFELRIYESHSAKAGKKKVEMFNEGGEIEIFRNTGLQPVFFGETLIGPQMPNLTYMLAFDDMAAREKAWATFRGDPAWKELRAKKEYADTVSNITDVFLRPMPYSQI